MKKSIVASLAVAVLVLAGCGSDSGGASGPQGEAADAAMAAAAEQGMELDEDCVDDLAAQLSDEDAEAIVAAGPDGDADISDEGTAIGVQLLSCADNEDLVDAFIEEMKANTGADFDEACVRESLEGVDMSEMAGEATTGTPEELVTAVTDCFDLGS
jgi:hypothetical protein